MFIFGYFLTLILLLANSVDSSKEIQNKGNKENIKTCTAYGRNLFSTFDDEIYAWTVSKCYFNLFKETRYNDIIVKLKNSPDCDKSVENCYKTIKLFIKDNEYIFDLDLNKKINIRNQNKTLSVPFHSPEINIEKIALFLTVDLDSYGIKIKWDGKRYIELAVPESYWNKTSGLCDVMNGKDDYVSNNSKIEKLALEAEKCEILTSEFMCKKDVKAEEYCSKLFSDPQFKNCDIKNQYSYIDSCKSVFCECDHADKSKCVCDIYHLFFKHCVQKGFISSKYFTDNEFCPIKCNGDKIFLHCGPRYQPTCSSNIDFNIDKDVSKCASACFCPPDQVLHNGQCIDPKKCPCPLRGEVYKPGTIRKKDCNECKCTTGKWNCTNNQCPGKCSIIGDPHYKTFDGKRFDFMGKCSYYLVKGNGFSIEAENVLCNNPPIMFDNVVYPSCTKSLKIRIKDTVIQLKKPFFVYKDDKKIELPYDIPYVAKIRWVSSNFIGIYMENGMYILWNGNYFTSVYITAPPSLAGKVQGLCGNFNNNQKDDFQTLEGDKEVNAVEFANKWKVNESCVDIKDNPKNPCNEDPIKKQTAEKYCSALKEKSFKRCHKHVNFEDYYNDCLYDLCTCDQNIDKCLCPHLANYASVCAKEGIFVPYMDKVLECQAQCPSDQEYQICGNNCARSCKDISTHVNCKKECVEGCNCPKNQTLNAFGKCVPTSTCPCIHEGLEFPPNYEGKKEGSEGLEKCKCTDGLWNCELLTGLNATVPHITNLKDKCDKSKNLEYVVCEPEKEKTCHNMHEEILQTTAVCTSGCVCKKGYVKNVRSGDCVKKEECPCYHGGQSFKESAIIREDCNTCTCESGKWNCTKKVCPGFCSVWGDSHFKTFDGNAYDFEGVCDYLLSKGFIDDNNFFQVSIKNVRCGTTGAACSKSITLSVGKENTTEHESIKVTRGQNLDMISHLKKINIKNVGLFVFFKVSDLGIEVFWDKGTRVYVKLDPKWKKHTEGLCGDYNDNPDDDFKTPTGGIHELSAIHFGDSWKLNNACSEPSDLKDTCLKHPERKTWAVEKCEAMKSSIFKSCHSAVDVEPFIEKCIFDSCACDDGGDCECLCTAIAAYAHECNMKGIPISWRSSKLCPIMCSEPCLSYSPCISSCTPETCSTYKKISHINNKCLNNTCVEGCAPKACPQGQIYLNSSYSDCVLPSSCKKPICLIINGNSINEDEVVEKDDCHTCFCKNGRIMCDGRPCQICNLDDPLRPHPNITDKYYQCVNTGTTGNQWVEKSCGNYMIFNSTIKSCIFEIMEQPVDADCLKGKCSVHNVPLEKSMAFVKILSKSHGVCRNTEPINGLTTCCGNCQEPIFIEDENNTSLTFQKTCCQPIEYKEIQLTKLLFNCEGKILTFTKILHVPKVCKCKNTCQDVESN